jgi:BASS family bile acid:Na+ symporter
LQCGIIVIELDTFVRVGLPLALFLIMLSMGLRLRAADFRPLLTAPRAFVLGLSAQLLLLPPLAALVCVLFDLPPALAVGLMILSACPGGTTSNLFSHLARGDLALSIALTTAAGFITPLTIPLVAQWALDWQFGATQAVQLPLPQVIGRLVLVSILPVLIGLVWHAVSPAQAALWQRRLQPLATALFASVIVAIIAQQWARIPQHWAAVGLACLAMIALALAAGWLLARAAGLAVAPQRTISIEVGMQNGGTALLVTQGVLADAQMSSVPLLYGVLMLGPVLLIVGLARYGDARRLLAQARV